MANQMFKGFGGMGMMMDDPFKDDPFFNGKGGGAMMGFGGMDKMMKEMRQGMMEGGMGKGGHSQFQVQSYSNTTTMGPDGKPVSQIYQTKTKGATGPDGKKITERHQMYDNQANGHQKMAHERMLDGQGRKVVKQRMGPNTQEENIYKRMNEAHGPQFDRDWENMANRVGWNGNNALGYAQSN